MNDLYLYSYNCTNITIDVCRSSPNQIKALPKIEDLCKYWVSKGYEDIIDIGCGFLRNSLQLVKYFNLYVCDFPKITESHLFKERYKKLIVEKKFRGIIQPNTLMNGQLKLDAAFVSFVLHTIPEKKDRSELINNIKKNLKPPYEIFIAVPCGELYYKNQRENQQCQFNDGFLCDYGDGRKTFYRDYYAHQLDRFMLELGFKVDKKFYVTKKRMRTYQSITQ